MTRFVHTVQTIYSDIQMLCDGSYGPPQQQIPKESRSSNGGSAILQLLKKDTVSAEVGTHQTISPVDVRSLLRREFHSPVIQESVRLVQSEMVRPIRMTHADPEMDPPKLRDRKGPIPCLTEEDVRQTLTEMLLSDQFVAHFYDRLLLRSQK